MGKAQTAPIFCYCFFNSKQSVAFEDECRCPFEKKRCNYTITDHLLRHRSGVSGMNMVLLKTLLGSAANGVGKSTSVVMRAML